jgi:hypothetical protein
MREPLQVTAFVALMLSDTRLPCRKSPSQVPVNESYWLSACGTESLDGRILNCVSRK